MNLNKKQYYRHLSMVQNAIDSIDSIDIMTITGFMDDSEKVTHLLRYAITTKDKPAIEFCKWALIA